MTKINTIILFLLFATNLYVESKPFKIIAPSNRRETTHQIASGNFILGLSDNGGGGINMVNLPGVGDIMDTNCDRYGRMGQIAIRDGVHGGRYNPTQAGFHETLGTQCEITSIPGKLTIEPHPIALWHGDGQYDFTRWENIGADPYSNDGGNSDVDGLDEENLTYVYKGVTLEKQEVEVMSEYDYFGSFEDYKGKMGVTIPCFRNYVEFRFSRAPGHCVNQHREGTKLYDGSLLVGDISKVNPSGVHKATAKELSNPIKAYVLRHDNSMWTAGYRYYYEGGAWKMGARDGNMHKDNLPKAALIVAESGDPNTGRAIGMFRPYSEINVKAVIGVNEADGSIVYTDERTNLVKTVDLPDEAANTMSKYHFTSRITGLIARDRLPAGVYEAWREEFYILYGTPQQIMDAIAAIESNGTVTKTPQTITFPALPVKQVGDADFDLGATATSGLDIAYTSSNLAVATILNGKIHVVGAGITTITATQVGNDVFSQASEVSQTLIVNTPNSLKLQLITFPALTEKTIGDTDFDAEASASSALAISYKSSNLNIATIVNGKIHIVRPGTVSITASQSGNTEFLPANDVQQKLIILANDTDTDSDGDGILDNVDNCPLTSNPDQADEDNDKIGDVCDAYLGDKDNDGVKDAVDNCPNIANPLQEDSDNDGIGNVCEIIHYKYPGKTWRIPGIIDARFFDIGGEGHAYHDSNPGLEKSSLVSPRTATGPEDVELDPTNVAYIKHDEWLKYTVDSIKSGIYTIKVNSAAQSYTANYEISLNDNVLASITANSTSNWQTYQEFSVANIKINTDYTNAVIKVRFVNTALTTVSLCNFKDLSFVKTGEIPAAGIDKITAEKAFSISPNPAGNVFSINAKNLNIKNIIIRNSLGMTVFVNPVSNISDNHNVIVNADFAKGIYFVSITDSQNKDYVEKLIIK